MFSSTRFNRFSALGALVIAFFINRAVLSNAHPMNPAGPSNAVAGQSSVKLDDQKYNTEPTNYCRRDAGFDTRKIVGGFEGKPAVLKQPKPTGGLTDELILKEIDFLNRFNLLLIENEEGEEKDDDGSYPIVSRDVREEYPEKDSPPMKLFHQWYLADPTMDAQDALERFWKSQKKALRTIATDFDLLHFNINLLSSYTTKDFSTIVPNSWVADRPGFLGVKDVADSSELGGSDPGLDESDSDEGYKSEPGSSEDEDDANDVIQNYIDHLEELEEGTGLPVAFRVGALREVLARIGEELHN